MNNAPGIGHNLGPYESIAAKVTDQLALDYAELKTNVKAALDDTESLPTVIESSADVEPIASAMKKLGDLSARVTSHRVAEKAPYLQAGDAVYAWFTKGLIEPLDTKRRQIGARLDAYKQRQLAEEKAKRAAEAEVARKLLLAAAKHREEAEAAASRARSAASLELRQAEARQAKIDADLAAARAETTALATMASSSAMVRERFEGERSGHVGMRKTPLVMIEDVAKLDLELLRPHFKEEHLLMALKSWAKATAYEQQMPGAVVTLRDATVVR